MRANGESIHQEKGVILRGLQAPLSAVALGIAVLMVAISIAGCGESGTGAGIPVYRSSGGTWETYPRVKQTGTVMTTEGILQPIGIQSVDAVVPDGLGGFYIGGDFTDVGGLSRNNIAHVLSDGNVDESWNPNANSAVHTLATDGSNVYAGGNFTTIGGETRNRIACLDSSGTATSWNPNANLYVSAIAVDGLNIYVGGGFTTIGGETRNHIACLDSSGAAISWDPDAEESVFSSVKALVVSGPYVYVGGRFTTIGGQARNHIACLDSSGLATSWNPNPDNCIINAIAVSGPYIYVGGDFTTIGGKSRNRIACLDSSGAATSWNPNANCTVHAIAVSGSDIYVGGSFSTHFNPIGGQNRTIGGQTRDHVACLDSSGAATSWEPIIGGVVYDLAISDSTVYVGCSPMD